MAVAVTVGVTIGAISGMARGWVDTVLMWLTDLFLSLPQLPLLLLVIYLFRDGLKAAFGAEGGVFILIVSVIGGLRWMPVARLAPVEELFANPRHPYTQGLIRSIPRVDSAHEGKRARLEQIPGSVPSLLNPPSGCRFAARCGFAIDACLTTDPMLKSVGHEHKHYGVTGGVLGRVQASDRVVELLEVIASARALYDNPLHPYTEALLSAVPIPDPKLKRKRVLLKGELPNPMRPPTGCHFHTRCPIAEARCSTEVPVLKVSAEGHQVACHLRG
eukprot:gene4279-4329_t